MYNPTRSVRKYPQRPVRQEPKVSTRTGSAEEAISCLNEFVKEARKEIRKQHNVKAKMTQQDSCASMLFVFDDFSLTLNFTERSEL